jgi:dolichol-phosphate mannosyltransferase
MSIYPTLTIIIPCYNEKNTIIELFDKIENIENISKEIIIVDDKSTDGSSDLIKNYNFKSSNKKIFHDKNLGKGGAIRSAQKFVNGKYVIIQDADLEYYPKDYYILLDKIRSNENNKVVYGSRVLKSNELNNIQNFSHKIRIYGNLFLTKLSNLLNNQNLTDAHTCYKMFRSEIFKKIKLQENDFAFCPEITTKLSLMNINIDEVPINYTGRSYDEGKKIVASDGIRAIVTIIKYRYFNKK